MRKTILITGGAGFIGSNFARYFFDKYPEAKVIVLDLLTYAGSVENLPAPTWSSDKDARFEFFYGNIMNVELTESLIAAADYVVHFAAESHVTRSISDNMQFFQTDVIGTQVVANAVCKYRDTVERFIHISTSEVYGSAVNEDMDESHPLNPMSPYAAAKAGADRLVYSYWATYGIPAVILRPFNNYGPRQHLEKVIPRFITSVILGEPLNIHGDGLSSRDFVHVDDTCRAVEMLLQAPSEKVVGECFNIGTGVSRSILSLADDIETRMTPKRLNNTRFIGNRPGQVERHTSNYSKIQKILGWKPLVKWDDGLQETINWYAANEEWWRKQLWLRTIPIVSASGKKELH